MYDFFDLEPSLPRLLTTILRYLIIVLKAGDPDETEVEPNP